MYGYIYKTTNLITNKIYIGQKKSEIFLENKYLGSGKKLKSSVNYYGKSNFKVELIDTAQTSDELNEKETYWIKKFNSTDKDIGYNIAKGGRQFSGDNPWNKGLNKFIDSRLAQSEETKLKRSESLKLAHLEGRHNIVYTPEIRAKMSEAAINRAHPPTTAGRKVINNGCINKCVKQEDLSIYLSDGWVLGKITNQVPWNKGLTKDTDARVMKYTLNRKITMNRNKPLSGDKNPNRIKFLNKLNSLDKEEFINDYNKFGKCYCLDKYKFGPKHWDEIYNKVIK